MPPSRYSVVVASLLTSTAVHAGSVTVSDAWIRALPGRLPAAGYFTLRNAGDREVSLTGASSPACGMVMLHKSSSANGMANMTDVDTVPVPAGGTARFEPGGLHLMCMDPKQLKPGNSVPMTLELSNGKNLTTNFVVKNARGH